MKFLLYKINILKNKVILIFNVFKVTNFLNMCVYRLHVKYLLDVDDKYKGYRLQSRLPNKISYKIIIF